MINISQEALSLFLTWCHSILLTLHKGLKLCYYSWIKQQSIWSWIQNLCSLLCFQTAMIWDVVLTIGKLPFIGCQFNGDPCSGSLMMAALFACCGQEPRNWEYRGLKGLPIARENDVIVCEYRESCYIAHTLSGK